MGDPGLIFLPEDLDYLIQSELKDRKRRKYNSWGWYQQPLHKYLQLLEGKVSMLAMSGLFRPVFLKKYIVGGQLAEKSLDTFQNRVPDTEIQWALSSMGSLCWGVLETLLWRGRSKLSWKNWGNYTLSTMKTVQQPLNPQRDQPKRTQPHKDDYDHSDQ